MELGHLLDEKQLADIEAKLKESKIQLEKWVKEYPLTSIALAVGAGYLLAKLLEKSRKQ